MTQYTPKAALPYAEITDAPNMQTFGQSLTTILDSVVVPKYALVATRDAVNPTPSAGDMCWCTDTGEIYIYKSSWVGLVPRTAVAGADTTRTNSTSLIDATGLSLPVEANSSYVIEGFIIYIGDSANDYSFSLNAPAGATGNWSGMGTVATSNSEGTNTAIFVGARSFGAAVTYDTNVATPFTLRPGGVLTTAGTAGNLKVQFAQGTAGSSTSATTKAGSYIQLTKVA